MVEFNSIFNFEEYTEEYNDLNYKNGEGLKLSCVDLETDSPTNIQPDSNYN